MAEEAKPKEKRHISNTKFAVYGTLAALTGVGIYFIVDYLQSQKTPTMAKISNDTGAINVLRDAGPALPGLPTPKAYTTKGSWCLCANGHRCSGTKTDCNCCNDHNAVGSTSITVIEEKPVGAYANVGSITDGPNSTWGPMAMFAPAGMKGHILQPTVWVS